jgi:protein-S-isoprenylcysteine O-methyltransferase Ste14
MGKNSKWLRPAVFGFYFVVVLEFLFMISPFALHFYSAYGPTLNILHGSPATAWLTGFYLPHFSTTSSAFINALKPAGFLLAGLGLLVFLIGVIQIYGAKLLRRGAVTGGLYRLVRHPQYLALTILGLGVTLVWPRFLVLISYVAMVFVYYALAKWEERQCLERFGRSYREYQRKTGMIFPRLPFRRASGDPREPGSWQRQVVIGFAAVALALVAAFALRAYSLASLSSHFTDDVAMLSPARLGAEEVEEAYRVARSDRDVDDLLEAEPKLLVYVVPADWFLPDLPLHTEEEIRRVGGGHRTPDPETRQYRVLFTRPRLHASEASGSELLTRAHGHEPLAIIRVDLDTESVISHDEVPDHVIWGDIPTPLF